MPCKAQQALGLSPTLFSSKLKCTARSTGSPQLREEPWPKQHRRRRVLWLIKPGLYRENTRITGNRKPKLL